MNEFTFQTASDERTAVKAAAATPGSAFLAGGTTLIDLWKLGAVEPENLIDVTQIDSSTPQLKDGILHLGATMRMSAAARAPEIETGIPMLRGSLLLAASPQIRNMATLGGNVLQQPRSFHFRNPDPRLREAPTRQDAIFGVTEENAAPHPSDFAVALAALRASFAVLGPRGARVIPIQAFYQVPDEKLTLTTLTPGELVTEIHVPVCPWTRRSVYVKIRDRSSYQFALVSAAVALEVQGSTIRAARIAAGGVGTKPWALPNVEDALVGQPNTPASYQSAIASVGKDARTHPLNAYKVELLRRTLLRAFIQAGEIA